MSAGRLLWAVFVVLALGTASGTPETTDRAVSLKGVSNTRDLGGLRTEDGRSIRKGQLIRSGDIDDMGDEGMELLDGMGVTAIVDLRTTREATAKPLLWPEGDGPSRYNFPLMEREDLAIADMRTSIKSGTAREEDTEALFFGAFRSIPADYTTEIRSFFDVLLRQPEGEAVLFHCSGGKDRTGVATALVLTALGVTREDIAADFMMSNVQKDSDNAAARIAEQVNAEQGTNMTPEAVWPSVGVRRAYLEEFYRSVTEGYGSVDAYLRDGLGLTDADLRVLRERYLD